MTKVRWDLRVEDDLDELTRKLMDEYSLSRTAVVELALRRLAVRRTKTGRVLTDADINQLAVEAEKGYDVKKALIRGGRLDSKSAKRDVVPVPKGKR